MELKAIIPLAHAYVSELFEQLPQGMYFHNLQHTCTVFDAVTEIGQAININETGLLITQLAALFHDTGYLYHYAGHEDNSKIIAGNYLMQHQVSSKYIEQVLACIDATKIPQHPQSIEQEIMCDADMYHFSRSDYLDFADRLKKEWEIYLTKYHTTTEWAKKNLDLLQKHRYYTTYGKAVLQSRKQENINELSRQIQANL